MYKNILLIILSILLALGEISLVWSWPYPFNLFSIFIPLLIFIIMFERKKEVWLVICSSGLIFDIFCFLPLGTHILLFATLYFFGRFLFYNYLSNPSFITSFILTAALTMPFKLFHHFINSADNGGMPMFFNSNELKIIGVSLFINLIAISLIYFGYKVIVKIIKPRGLLYGKI